MRRLLLTLTLLLGAVGMLAQDDEVTPIEIEQGYGAEKGFWQVYFNAPTGESDRSTYDGGIDLQLVAAIEDAQATLDIAAFEWGNPRLTEAVVDAYERGVQVRMVVDDEHVIEENEILLEEDEEAPFQAIIDAGIPFVDDDRSALMHNKFMIIDSEIVWQGSMNYTMNGTYRNNNNMIALRSRDAVAAYQTEFNEMFVREEFGPTSTDDDVTTFFAGDGAQVGIYFASEGDVVEPLLDVLDTAEESIHFMAFSFTEDRLGVKMIERAYAGIEVQGIFELRGSETRFSEMGRMYCNALNVRQDGNPYILHHKVIIVDEEIVISGSFNFSDNATQSNDENLVIIADADLAAQFMMEFDRLWGVAEPPDAEDMECNLSVPEQAPWVDVTGSVSCPSANTCGDLTCGEAYACLGEGLTRLDRDSDGVPCEAICPGGDR